mmetsp:Transcript_11496/g.32219  ORF Transcript_11496/g.32219 Transcript_11496/m.32219 type:complete len:202 (-) Transcript_11496:2208-2813(-)
MANKPVLQRLGVVDAVDIPLPQDRQILLEMQQEIGRGRLTPGKEVLRHPIVLALYDIVKGQTLCMNEDVNEEHSSRTQPRRYPGQQRLVVLHVLEHFDRHHPIKRLAFKLGRDDVLRLHGQVLDSPGPRLPVNVLFLRPRVRYCRDPGFRQLMGHEQRQRSPPASELQNITVKSSGQLRPLARELHHLHLGLLQSHPRPRV